MNGAAGSGHRPTVVVGECHPAVGEPNRLGSERPDPVDDGRELARREAHDSVFGAAVVRPELHHAEVDPNRGGGRGLVAVLRGDGEEGA